MPKKPTYFSRNGEGSWVTEFHAAPCGGGRGGGRGRGRGGHPQQHQQHPGPSLRGCVPSPWLALTAPRRQQGSDADPGHSAAQRGALSLGCALLPGLTEGHGAQSLALRIDTGLQLALNEASHRPLHHPGAQREPSGTNAALSAPAPLSWTPVADPA